MTSSQRSAISNTELSSTKFELFCIGSLFLLMAVSTPYAIYTEASKLATVKLLPAAIMVKSGSLALLSSLPTLTIFIWASIKRWRNRYTSNDANTLVKTLIVNFPIILLVLIANKWYVSDYLTNHRYSPCRSYTSASMYAGRVWTRSTEYCLKDASIVSNDLVRWAEEQAKMGDEITPEQLQEKANQLLADSPFNR